MINSDGFVHSLVLKKVDSSNAAKYTIKTSGPSSSGSLYVEGNYNWLKYNVNKLMCFKF